ncbi:putative acyl-CoA transferases/ carnitine dehydratase [Rhodococcus ruber BKS 20-38]|uniref:Putative acyl-CoA transferases/ carnitine dehydratase n=1 Tax=Rhodococcus ruber BKS 20-38 TaxID=1278076 RepID=M2ZJ58_9NOCA|nr:putative acyl-CoA transferases/ carnitine dehydratase [Rhodococcus ruber BKS 20-38]
MRDWAESGIASLTGRPDGPPLIPPGRAATMARERTAWIADVTGGAVSLDGARMLAERAAFTGHRRAGGTSAGGSCRLLPMADGWAAVSCARPDDPLLLGALVGADVGDDPWPAVQAWLRGHTGAELAERADLLGVAAGPVTPAHAPAPLRPRAPRPVDGLLVVDFSALWAGPLCAHLLGLAGARVIKVEIPSRPDGARRGNPGFYRLLHGGHEAVMLDPARDCDRVDLAALVAAADIVIEASRPRALAGFGLDADEFVTAGATWISITAHGRASNRVGFGDDIAAAAGLVARDGDGPVFVGDALADPLAGLTAAALAMSAPGDGGGVLWDLSMAATVAATLDPPGAEAAQTYRRGEQWYVDTATGPARIEAPHPRTPRGDVAAPGRDTAAVLAELGMPR